jgi:hypothetical protein
VLVIVNTGLGALKGLQTAILASYSKSSVRELQRRAIYSRYALKTLTSGHLRNVVKESRSETLSRTPVPRPDTLDISKPAVKVPRQLTKLAIRYTSLIPNLLASAAAVHHGRTLFSDSSFEFLTTESGRNPRW